MVFRKGKEPPVETVRIALGGRFIEIFLIEKSE